MHLNCGRTWDAGTARLLELLGFKALATTSAGFSVRESSEFPGAAKA